ncbi:MAG: PHP domain-containing protein [Chloroflexi bacterium]|nr:PHP domain-containing protein [Chloroflexota bacterium]
MIGKSAPSQSDSIFDLHPHTTKGSSDSNLSPEELAREAKRLGLHGVCLTEHSGWHSPIEFQEFAHEQGLVVVRGLEVATDMGHVLVFGLDGYLPGILDLRELRRVVIERRGYMVLAHPFRNSLKTLALDTSPLVGKEARPRRSPRDTARAPIFQWVDEIEVVNGATSDEENRMALEAAWSLGRRGTGGSDAHSTHGIGRGVTVFHGLVRDQKDLLEALGTGSFTPGEGFNSGRLTLFEGPL